MNARGVDFTGIAYLAALAIAGIAVYQLVKAGPDAAKKAGALAKRAVDAINPTNPDNIFAQGANAATRFVTGDPHDTVGTALHRYLNDSSKPDPTGAKVRAAFTAADQDDADQGAAMRAMGLGLDFVGTADYEDAELGAAMRAGGSQFARLPVTPGFSYVTRTGKNF